MENYGIIVVQWWFCWKSTYISVGLTSRIYSEKWWVKRTLIWSKWLTPAENPYPLGPSSPRDMKGMNVSRLSVAFTPVPPVQDFIDYKLLVPIQNYSPCLAAFFLNDGFPNKRLVNSLYTDRSIFCLGRVPFWSLFLSSIFAY